MPMNAGYSGPLYEAASDDSSSLKRKSMSLDAQAWKEKWRLERGSRPVSLSQGSGMTIPASEMRRESRRGLRRRLRDELSIVQRLYSKIETKELQLKRKQSHSTAIYTALSDAQFSGNDARSIGGKEVTSSHSLLSDHHGRPMANFIGRKSKSGKKKPSLLAQCKAILKKLMGHKDGWIFNEPVDAEKLGLADYGYFIRKPMDLGTIKARLEKRGYSSLEHFASDVRLTFDNAMTYNPPGNDVHEMAKGLRDIFEKSWTVVSSKLVEEERVRQIYTFPGPARDSQAALREEFERKNPQPKRPASANTAAVAINKKIKARSKPKESGKTVAPPQPKTAIIMSCEEKPVREMSYEEKKNLVESLQLLPAPMQDEIIRLMKERNPDLSQKDDEIEVDIDCFDKETLWELDACVKTGLQSMEATGTAEGPLDQSLEHAAGAEDNLQRSDPVQEVDIDIMGDAPKGAPSVTKHNDGASGENKPDSSGNSSSDTGSSDDSDSDSSSSDSDAEA